VSREAPLQSEVRAIVDEARLPLVTVLVPSRNEARFIESCLTSIVSNGYPESLLQVLVIDGQSDDGTVGIVQRFERAHPCVQLIENPRRITPSALNLGVKAASGEFIVWMSAHNSYDAGYIRNCVEWAIRSGADNVGGVIAAQPRENTLFGRAITLALGNRFGNGGSRFRMTVAEPVWADTVFGGCYRRDVFTKIGLFNESLVRGQDFEFNVRLHRAGLKTLLVPGVRSTYYARSRPLDFLKHNWANGVWAILPFRYSDVVPVSFRHLVPMLFVGFLIVTGLLGIWVHPVGVAGLIVFGLYVLVTLQVSVEVAREQRDARLFFVMPIVFWSLHLTYGLGSLWAAVRSIGALWRHATMIASRTSRVSSQS
jgi:glycosyltransferase involved in cell wall biosynthesis